MITFTIEKPKEISFGIQNVDLGADAYDRGYEEGEAEGYNKGVAEYQWVQYGKSLFAMFENATFPENTEIMLKMPNFSHRMDSAFRAAKKLKKITLVCENWNGYVYGVTASQAFATMTAGLEVIDLSKFNVIYGDVNLMFSSNYSMREIIGELNFSLSTNNSSFLSGCGKLEEIRFVAGCLKTGANFSPCGKLSDSSIQSIIDGLADLTGQTAQTLTLHATVGGKLTQAQKDAASAKNWTLAY